MWKELWLITETFVITSERTLNCFLSNYLYPNNVFNNLLALGQMYHTRASMFIGMSGVRSRLKMQKSGSFWLPSINKFTGYPVWSSRTKIYISHPRREMKSSWTSSQNNGTNTVPLLFLWFIWFYIYKILFFSLFLIIW